MSDVVLADTVTDRKLSYLMREGAKLRPQCFGGYYLTVSDDEIGSCAIGAAAEAASSELDNDDADEFNRRFVLDQTVNSLCPVCGTLDDGREIRSVIPHLNDEHRWTREAIADWLESIGL